MNQLEDDIHRVLQLARAESRLKRHAPARSTAAATASRHNVHHAPAARELARQRYRHADSTERRRKQTPRDTLLRAKLQSISAIYGLENAIPKLSDVSTRSARLHHLESSGDIAARDTHETNDPHQQAALEATLATRRKLYKRHYSGLRAAYGPTGKPTLECLLDAATSEKQQMARHSALAVGAAVLTSGNRIFASSTIESIHDATFTICAERVALLKAISDDPREVVTAMAIVSDDTVTLPSPCGSCREFMAECGDFAVVLVNARGASEETRSFELFPRARQRSTVKVQQHQSSRQTRAGSTHGTHGEAVGATTSDAQATGSRHAHNDGDTSDDDNNAAAADHTTQLPMRVQDWTNAHVLQWLADAVELPQYCSIFASSAVDGCLLLRLEDCDLQLLLGVLQPLHRRRLLVHIDRLKDRELLEHGIDYRQLQDYLAVLDRDRITVVAELKATFDRLDRNRDGFLDFREVRHALRTLDCDATPQAVDALLRSQLLSDGSNYTSSNGNGRVSFAAFAAAFSSLAMQQPTAIQSAPAVNSDTWQLPVVDIHAVRRTFDRADTNKSGSIDVHELAVLFQGLATEQGSHSNTETLEEGMQRARTWLDATDHDHDGRLSFAEFFVRYLQLSGLDILKLLTLYDATEPRASARCKPVGVLKRALETFYPDVSPATISVWYKRHLNTSLLREDVRRDDLQTDATTIAQTQVPPQCDVDATTTAAAAAPATGDSSTAILNSTPAKATRSQLTISRDEFVLGVFLFQDHMRARQQQMREVKAKLSNDALVHKSRIVHLQQLGHVRLCPQVPTSNCDSDNNAPATKSLAAVRREQRQQRMQVHKHESDTDEEAKGASESDATVTDKRRKRHFAQLLAKVDATFDRFARAKIVTKQRGRRDAVRGQRSVDHSLSATRRSNSSSRKQQRRPTRSKDDDDDGGKEETKSVDESDDAHTNEVDGLDAYRLNAIETAQAMTELGIAQPRDQMLRLLKEEGIGIHDSVDRHTFRRLFCHCHTQSASTLGSFPAHRRSTTGDRVCFWNEDDEHAKRMDDMVALLRGEFGRHRNREDYDAYLLRGRNGQVNDMRDASAGRGATAPHRRKSWKTEMVRFQTEKQQKQKRSSSSGSASRGRKKKTTNKSGRQQQRKKKQKKKATRARSTDDEAKDDSSSSSDDDSSQSSDSSTSSNSDMLGRSSKQRHVSKRGSRAHRSRRRSDSHRSASSRRHRSRKSRRRSSDSHSSSHASSFSSNETTPSEPELLASRRRHQSEHHRAKWRGLEIGDRVQSASDGGGTIIRLYRDYFVADVHFDSGVKAKNVDLSKLRRVNPLDDEAAARRASYKQRKLQLRVGTQVAVSHRGTKTVRRGKIVTCRLDRTFDVLVNELGEHEMLKRVQHKHLRAVVGKPLVYVVGARVMVRQKHAYLRGTVQLCHSDGTYDVCTRQDNHTLKHVLADLLSPDDASISDSDGSDDEDRQTQQQPSKAAATNQSASSKHRAQRSDDDEEAKENTDDDDDARYDDFEPEFKRGDRVESRYQGGVSYYPGKITRVLTDGTYDITYDDGDTEDRVKSSLLRPLAADASTKPGTSTRQLSRARDDDDYGSDGFESS